MLRPRANEPVRPTQLVLPRRVASTSRPNFSEGLNLPSTTMSSSSAAVPAVKASPVGRLIPAPALTPNTRAYELSNSASSSSSVASSASSSSVLSSSPGVAAKASTPQHNNVNGAAVTATVAAKMAPQALGEPADIAKKDPKLNVVALIDTFDNILKQTARLSQQISEHSNQMVSMDTEEKQVVQLKLRALKSTIDAKVGDTETLTIAFRSQVHMIEDKLSKLLQSMSKVLESGPAAEFIQLVSTLVSDPRETWKAQGMLEMVTKEREKMNGRFKKRYPNAEELSTEDKNTKLQNEIALKRQELDFRTTLMDLRSGLIKQLWTEFESRVTKMNTLLNRDYLKQYDDLFVQYQSTSSSVAQFQRNQAALKGELVKKRNLLHGCWIKLEKAQDTLLKQLAPKCGDPQFATKILQAFPSYEFGMEPAAEGMNPDNIKNNCDAENKAMELLRAQEFGGALIGPSPDSFHTDTIACWPPGSGKTPMSAAAMHAFYQRYLVQESIREHGGSFDDTQYEIPPCGAFILTNEPSQVADFAKKCGEYFRTNTKCKDIEFKLLLEHEFLDHANNLSAKFTAVFTLTPVNTSVRIPVPFTCVIHTYFKPLQLNDTFMKMTFQTTTQRNKEIKTYPWSNPDATRVSKTIQFMGNTQSNLPSFSTKHLLPYGHALIIVDEIHAFTDFPYGCDDDSFENRSNWAFAILWSTKKKMLSLTGTPFANADCLNQFFRIVKLHLGRGDLKMPSWYEVDDLLPNATKDPFVTIKTADMITWYIDPAPDAILPEIGLEQQAFWLRALFGSSSGGGYILTQKAKEKMWKLHAGLFSYFTLANDPTRYPSRLQYLDITGAEKNSFKRLNVLTSRHDGFDYKEKKCLLRKDDPTMRSTMQSIPIFCDSLESKMEAALQLIQLDPEAKHFFFFEGAESSGSDLHEKSTRNDMNVWLNALLSAKPAGQDFRYVYLSQWGILDMMIIAMTRGLSSDPGWTKFNADKIADMLYTMSCSDAFAKGSKLANGIEPTFMNQFRYFRQNDDVAPPRFIMLFKDISYIAADSPISRMQIYEQVLQFAMTDTVVVYPIFMKDDIDLENFEDTDLYKVPLDATENESEFAYLCQFAKKHKNYPLLKDYVGADDLAKKRFDAQGVTDLRKFQRDRIVDALEKDRNGYLVMYAMAKQMKKLQGNVLSSITEEATTFPKSQIIAAQKGNIISTYIRTVLEPYELSVMSSNKNKNISPHQTPEKQQDAETEFLAKLNADLEQQPQEQRNKQREVIDKLSGSFFGSVMMALYNHEENKKAQYFPILLGNSNIAMGLDILTTRNVYFPKPPSSLAVRVQARDRTSRFCCFKQDVDTNNWWTRDIVFININDENEKPLFDAANNDILAQLKQIPQEGALDCYLFRAFNTGKGQPYECMDDSGRVSKGTYGLKVEFSQKHFYFVTLPQATSHVPERDKIRIEARYADVTAKNIHGFAITTLRIPAQYTPFYDFVLRKLEENTALKLGQGSQLEQQMLRSIQAMFHLLKTLSVTMDPIQWIQMEADVQTYVSLLCKDHRGSLKNMITFVGNNNIQSERSPTYATLKDSYTSYKQTLTVYNATKTELLNSLESKSVTSEPAEAYTYLNDEAEIVRRGLTGSSRLLRYYK